MDAILFLELYYIASFPEFQYPIFFHLTFRFSAEFCVRMAAAAHGGRGNA
jgi:hypothetical protein